jgi:hypothetical protein
MFRPDVGVRNIVRAPSAACLKVFANDVAHAESVQGSTRTLRCDRVSDLYRAAEDATLEDGLWVLEKNLKDPAFAAKMAKFVKASMKGWDYAKNHPDEAVKIILERDSTGAKTAKDQMRMMTEIGKLLGATDGKLDVKDYDRTVATLMSGGSDPVITKKPEGAYNFAIYDSMK